MDKHRLGTLLATTALTGFGAAMAGAPAALADSSGNFNAVVEEAQCQLATDTGKLTGGLTINTLTTTIQTPNGSGTTLLITPSFATGLFTDTLINKNQQSSSETAAVKVFVKLDGEEVPPATDANPGVTYDERFQQLSSNIFNDIGICGASLVSVGPSSFSLVTTLCSIDLILSTLEAHSFNFVWVDPGTSPSPHKLTVDWAIFCSNNGGSFATSNCSTTFAPNTAAACVGPGTVTVQQVKNFHNDGTISIGP